MKWQQSTGPRHGWPSQITFQSRSSCRTTSCRRPWTNTSMRNTYGQDSHIRGLPPADPSHSILAAPANTVIATADGGYLSVFVHWVYSCHAGCLVGWGCCVPDQKHVAPCWNYEGPWSSQTGIPRGRRGCVCQSSCYHAEIQTRQGIQHFPNPHNRQRHQRVQLASVPNRLRQWKATWATKSPSRPKPVSVKPPSSPAAQPVSSKQSRSHTTISLQPATSCTMTIHRMAWH